MVEGGTCQSEGRDAAIHALGQLPRQPHVITIGNFDGVHRGHRYLIQRVIDEAQARSARSLVITFEPHPTQVLRPDVPFQRLTSGDEKLRLIRATTVDDLVVIAFDRSFASLEPDEFLALVTDAAAPMLVFVGEGFRFGRGRAGDGETIRLFGAAHGFDTTVIQRLRDGDTVISSSSVRQALQRGDIASANMLLGRRYRLSGTVEHGAARGRELGFPTANLLLPIDACVPSDGIYAALAHVRGERSSPYWSMVYIGTRPTFDNGDRIVEANLLDFSGDLYTRELEVEFVGRIRGDRAFESPEALTAQMHADETDTRVLLTEAGTTDIAQRTD